MLVLILPTPEGWKAESTLAEKKVTQIFDSWPGQESNLGPSGREAEILPLRQPCLHRYQIAALLAEICGRLLLTSKMSIVTGTKIGENDFRIENFDGRKLTLSRDERSSKRLVRFTLRNFEQW